MTDRLEINVLGPLEIRIDGEKISAGGPRQRSLLVLLLLETGRVLGAEEISDRLWNGRPPHSAASTLHAYISRLRRVLGDRDASSASVLRSSPSGYQLTIADHAVDARRFEQEVVRGRRLQELGDHAAAAATLRGALDLWRGDALADFVTEQWAHLEIVRLDELRRGAEEAWADSELALGNHHALIPWLEQQVAQNPLRERSVGQLMLALYRSGRQAEALAACLNLRQVLAADLGIDPSPSIERLYRAILNHDRLELALAPTDNLPTGNRMFEGRAATLRAMRDALTSPDGPNVVALHGLGGVGKTELAVEYARRYAQDYDLRWLVPAAEPAALCRALAELAHAVGLPDHVDCGDVVATTAAHLEERSRWLLVLDDVEDESVIRCLPRRHRGHVIITSRSPVWSRHASKIQVDPFARDESVSFLRRRLRTTDTGSAQLLAEELGDLPLALDQASAFVERTGMGLDEYLDLFRRHTPELLNRGGERTVATVWRLAFDAVAKASPVAHQLLQLCAALDAHTMPLTLLHSGRDVLPDALAQAAAEEIGLEDAIATLLRHGLVQREAHQLKMHRLVRTAAFLALDETQAQSWIERAVHLVAAAMPADPQDPSTWTTWDDIMSPVLALALRFEHQHRPHPADLLQVLCTAGTYLTTRALFSQAGRLLELAVCRAAPLSADLAGGLTALGKLREATGNLDGARLCLEQALAIAETVLTDDHPTLVTALRRLGSVLMCQRKLPEARRALERALAVLATDGDTKSEELAACYRELGFVEWAAGDLRAAEATFSRALAATSRSRGTGHPEVAHVLSGLAWVHQESGNLPRAAQLHEQSLAVLVAVYGDEHPEVAHIFDKLGYVHHLQGDLDAAVAHHDRALRILESCYGTEHGELGWPLTNLGLAHAARGDLDAAAYCQRRAMDMFTGTFGAKHANTQIAARRLGTVMLRAGDAEGARDLLHRVLRDAEEALGPSHPDVGRALTALAEAHAALGDARSACDCRTRALTILEPVYGREHPDVVEASGLQPELTT